MATVLATQDRVDALERRIGERLRALENQVFPVRYVSRTFAPEEAAAPKPSGTPNASATPETVEQYMAQWLCPTEVPDWVVHRLRKCWDAAAKVTRRDVLETCEELQREAVADTERIERMSQAPRIEKAVAEALFASRATLVRWAFDKGCSIHPTSTPLDIAKYVAGKIEIRAIDECIDTLTAKHKAQLVATDNAWRADMAKAVAEAVANEREECAKIVDAFESYNVGRLIPATKIAVAIRRRGTAAAAFDRLQKDVWKCQAKP